MKSYSPKQAGIRIATRVIFFLLLPAFSFSQSDVCTTPTALNSVGTGAGSCVALTLQTLQGKTQSSPNPTSGTCGGTPGVDVWYSFVAQSTNPTVRLSVIGSNLSGSTGGTKVQILSGTCPSGFISEDCATGTGTTLTVTGTGLNINQTYFVRVYTNATNVSSGSSASWGFSICITNPVPGNDDCSGATLLTSSTSCVVTEGNLGPAVNSTPTITAPSCVVGTAFDDLWYRFVAQTTNPTITLGGLSNFANPGMQLLDNNCGGTFTSLFCGATSIAADFLVPGATYYIRVYSTTNITASAGFDICITDPVATVPPNDESANAINLLTNPSCSDVPGTVSGATNSGVAIAPCTSPVVYDVWYKFTAISTTSTITLSAIGSNFNTPRMQLLTNALVHISCGTTSISATTVAGTTYYVRVYSANGPITNGNADFNICVRGTGTGGQVRSGNSYVNITRKTIGGVVQTGDVLEIRMTINHTVTSGTFSRLRFVDNIPSYTTMATTAPNDSIRIITNEGLTYKKYQINAASDAASYLPSPVPTVPAGQYNIRLNLGFQGSNPGVPPDNTSTNTTATNGTMIAATNGPRGGGGMLFAIAYRVVVTGIPGQKIVLNTPRFIYYDGTSDVTLTGIPFEIMISDPLTLCTNSVGVNVASEFGGTFGSGTATNRSTDLTIPIKGYSFVSNVNANNTVGDGRYALVKNLSPRNRTVPTARREPYCAVGPALNINDPLNCNNRMYGHWFVAGDHSGTNTAAGNAPPASTTSGGYMLMVNADYVASEIYRQDISNLCPNTYYEFSAWIKNICATCGVDSVGDQFDGTPTSPAAGYPGVYPNLSFLLNDVDYYSTGEVDTLGWLKKGFVFKTGPLQTSATFSIRNNAQGGGGNDWVMDDIAVATCFPNMSYSPSASPNVCMANIITITDTVRSYFDNYKEYKWQRSTTGIGGPWTDITAPATATLTLTGGVYQFVGSFTVPVAWTTAANSGDLYRLVVASTTTNLAGTTCSYSDPTTITLTVLTNCGPPLKADLLSASGRLHNNVSKISWVTADEDEQVTFNIEKSSDGNSFTNIATVKGYFDRSAPKNYYDYIDPVAVTAKTYYRVVMINSLNTKKYSSIIVLNPTGNNKFDFGGVTNPFASNLQFEINSGVNGTARIELIDGYGKTVKSENQQLYAGSNSLNMYNISTLPDGVYVLRAILNGNTIYRKVVKGK